MWLRIREDIQLYEIADFQKSGQIFANFGQSTAVTHAVLGQLLKGISIEKTYVHKQNILHFIYNFNTKK
jgi:hypothetical protein